MRRMPNLLVLSALLCAGVATAQDKPAVSGDKPARPATASQSQRANAGSKPQASVAGDAHNTQANVGTTNTAGNLGKHTGTGSSAAGTLGKQLGAHENGLGAYGKSGVQKNGTFNAPTPGSGSLPGSSQGGGHRGNVDLPNGGSGSVADTPSDAPAKPDGGSNSGGELLNKVNDHLGHPHDGKDSHGNTWVDGKLYTGYDSEGVYHHNGHQASPGSYKNKFNPDTNEGTAGGGGRSGSGGRINTGSKGGGDGGQGGNGQTDQGGSGGTGVSATGKTVNLGGSVDAPGARPKATGVLKADATNKGNVDPNPAGGNSHHH